MVHLVQFYFFIFQLRIPTAVQPMKGIEGFKYQASDGYIKLKIDYFLLDQT